MYHRTTLPLVSLMLIVAVLALLGLGLFAIARIDVWGQHGSGLPKAFSYDIKDYQKTDPALIGYRETGKIALKLLDPRAVAVGPDNRIYVAGGRAIQIFNPGGSRDGEIVLDIEPRCLAVAGTAHSSPDRIYVGTNTHVEVFDSDGARLAVWEQPGPKSQITSIALAEDAVFVADAGERVVLRYDLAGKLLGRIGGRDDRDNLPGFIVPSPYFDVAIAPDGLLRVVNTGVLRVETYTLDGTLQSAWRGQPSVAIRGFSGCCNPAHIAILPNGNIVTAEKGLPRVKVYTNGGEFVCVVAGPESFLPTATAAVETRDEHKLKVIAVATDSHGRVLVLDPGRRSVRIFEPKESLGGTP